MKARNLCRLASVLSDILDGGSQMTKVISIMFSAMLLAALCVRGSSTISPSAPPHVFHYENVLGTSLELKILVASDAQSERAAAAVLAEIDRENKILSSWDPNSEFGHWFKTVDRPVHVSPELFEVLKLFDQWRERTQGALDASAETITRVWQTAAAQHRLPSKPELRAAVAKVQRVHWKLDAANRTATHMSNAPLAMNSFVKSYIAGRSADAALAVPGVRGIVVNIGGDLVVRGDLAEAIDVGDPKSDAENGVPIAQLIVRNRTIATSGDYRRGVQIAGQHYSHIVDPRTGMTADEIISSTVVAPNPADAGALATAFSVLSPEESRRVAATIPGVEYLLVRNTGERVASKGWSSLEVSRVPPAPPNRTVHKFQLVAQQAPESMWDPTFELIVGIELSHINGFRVNRPYVAVWIEDEGHLPVRTIALWFAKYRFLSELRSWSRTEELRSNSEDTHVMNSVSSATRPPGKYSFRWDGKDDFGRPVKAGKYTVQIEASREHGTYQLMRQDMDFSGVPAQFQLPGGVEIASAFLDYHKIAH
jgi:thiamine biosynthesis lipoprotein